MGIEEVGTIIGTGGIGGGIIYRLEGRHALGKGESRAARKLGQRDFCKQHIVLHYIARVFRGLRRKVRVFPVGAVGADATGRQMIRLMRGAGMDTRFVAVAKETPTLFSVCYQYPGGEGGNFTQRPSASDGVSSVDIRSAWKKTGGAEAVFALPEVPLASRALLLKLGRERGAFTAASFTTGEMAQVLRTGLLRWVDLLTINADEAAMLAGEKNFRGAATAARAFRRAASLQPRQKIVVTLGSRGAYAHAEGRTQFLPALKVRAINTAGAGDAFLAGAAVGLLAGLPFMGKASAFSLGRLFAAYSVTCKDTLALDFSLPRLRRFAAALGEKTIL